VVGGGLAISWLMVVRVEVGAVPIRANSPCASVVWAGNCRMSNTRVVFEMEAEGQANQIEKTKKERVAPRGGGKRENVHQVLDLDRNPRMLVVTIHEEAINQFPGMAYFGGVLVVEK
jgi:hypothetical protein